LQNAHPVRYCESEAKKQIVLHGARISSEISGGLDAVVLNLRSLAKNYDSRRILTDVSFELRRGEVMALCGASGSGKTTLIRIICGLTGFDAGELRVDGGVIQTGAPYPRRLFGKIGVVFQDHNLFPHMTVLENVTLAPREYLRLPSGAARERGYAELERMGVAALADRRPANLSGGEKQRVAIARALAVDPLALLLDEPTASLDPNRVDEVRDRILELADSGMTMLLATHNIELARHSARSFALIREKRLQVSRDPALLESLRERLE